MGPSTIDSDTVSLQAPRHPVPQLQGPFEESMAESINESTDNAKPDPTARRTMLIEGPTYERVCAGRWKQKPGEKFHPLWKISAQMSFGIHLLAEGLAKSEEDVMNILQTHVDDVDGFLESTTEDFDLAQSDVSERLRYLKLPLEHVDVFDRMLEDRAFRVSIVEGNEKIEHIMERTSEATKDALKDIQKGLQATNALEKYLEKVNLSWTTRNDEHDAVFVAMVGNVDGWHRAFQELYHQGDRLGKSLVELAAIVSEMQRRAGVASRKTLLRRHEQDDATSQGQDPSSRQLRNRETYAANILNAHTKSPQVPSKPLPKAPGVSVSSIQTTRRTSFQDTRSGQTSSGTSEDKGFFNKGEYEGQPPQMPVFGDGIKRLKNQTSAPDLKLKPDVANRADLKGSSELASLGLGPGLGLARMMETNSSRPVIVQRHAVQSGLGSSGTQLDPKMKEPREQSARVLTVPVQDQAPPQGKRPSFSLRNKAKDRQVDAQLNTAPRKAPDNPLKSPLSPRVGSSPESAGTPNKAASPALSPSHGSPDNSYSSKPLNLSPSLVRPSSGQPIPASAAAAKPPQKYGGRNPAFTSHPPNMEMATSPPLEQGRTAAPLAGPLEVPCLRAVPDLDSGNTSYESSLGEPGPEVSATEDGDETAQETPIAELDSGSSVAQGPVELEAVVPTPSQPIVFELEAPQQSQPVAPNTGAKMSPLTPTMGATIQSHSDFFKLPPQQAGDDSSGRFESEGQPTQASPPFVAKDRSHTALLHRSFQLPAADQSKPTGLLPRAIEESRNAVRHRSFQLPAESPSNGTRLSSRHNDRSPNRAPENSFELPADTETQSTSLDLVSHESRKAQQHRSFQLPPESRIEGTSAKSSEQGERRSTVHRRSFQLPPADNSQANPAKTEEENDKGDPSDLPRDDRQTLPSRTAASETRSELKRQSPKHYLNLIDIISHTPPGSPIHERPTSSASYQSAANSARLSSYRASVDLAPPEGAPAPIAPGGRGMVTPDYASAGAFVGEKRAKRTSSGASVKGLKRMLSGGSASHSRAGSVRVVEVPEGRMSGGVVHDNVDLMTPGGSDVLWFKGMGRDGVWVSGN